MDNLIGELDMFQREHEAKEKARIEKQQLQHNGNNHEYQVPNNCPIIQTQKTLHNDSIISTSTKIITGTYSHAFSNDECSEKNIDKISLNASLNYSITSNSSMMTNTTLSDIQKFNSSDNNNENYCWTDNNNHDDLSADTGFENPSFRHLNDTNIVLMRDDHDLPPSYYSQNATDVVVLRSKTNSMGSNNNSITDLNTIGDMTFEQKQRLSSFKLDNNNLSLTPNGSPLHYFSSSTFNNNINNSINNNNSIPSVNKGSLHSSFGTLMYGQTDEPASNNVNVNNNVNVVTSSNKPAVTPRPASLLSGILFTTYYTYLLPLI